MIDDKTSQTSSSQIEQAGASDESIQRVHSILLRENAEPKEGFTPMPLFLLGFISTMIFICSIYMVTFRGGFSPMVYDERYDPSKVKAGAGEVAKVDPIAQGKKLYQTCATCHQANGKGVAGVYPPLAASEWVVGNENRLIRVLLHGLNGPIVVKDNQYNGAMPAFGKVPGGGYNWSDDKIAYVLTYIRQEWGNNAPEISPAKVTEILQADKARTKNWTAAELEAFK